MSNCQLKQNYVDTIVYTTLHYYANAIRRKIQASNDFCSNFIHLLLAIFQDGNTNDDGWETVGQKKPAKKHHKVSDSRLNYKYTNFYVSS